MEAAVGRVAAESLAIYPPGIPNVFPGERVTAETLSHIKRTIQQGGAVRGLSDPTLRTIRVATEAKTEPHEALQAADLEDLPGGRAGWWPAPTSLVPPGAWRTT